LQPYELSIPPCCSSFDAVKVWRLRMHAVTPTCAHACTVQRLPAIAAISRVDCCTLAPLLNQQTLQVITVQHTHIRTAHSQQLLCSLVLSNCARIRGGCFPNPMRPCTLHQHQSAPGLVLFCNLHLHVYLYLQVVRTARCVCGTSELPAASGSTAAGRLLTLWCCTPTRESSYQVGVWHSITPPWQCLICRN
jgi:hypothetical protein